MSVSSLSFGAVCAICGVIMVGGGGACCRSGDERVGVGGCGGDVAVCCWLKALAWCCLKTPV